MSVQAPGFFQSFFSGGSAGERIDRGSVLKVVGVAAAVFLGYQAVQFFRNVDWSAFKQRSFNVNFRLPGLNWSIDRKVEKDDDGQLTDDMQIAIVLAGDKKTGDRDPAELDRLRDRMRKELPDLELCENEEGSLIVKPKSTEVKMTEVVEQLRSKGWGVATEGGVTVTPPSDDSSDFIANAIADLKNSVAQTKKTPDETDGK